MVTWLPALAYIVRHGRELSCVSIGHLVSWARSLRLTHCIVLRFILSVPVAHRAVLIGIRVTRLGRLESAPVVLNQLMRPQLRLGPGGSHDLVGMDNLVRLVGSGVNLYLVS